MQSKDYVALLEKHEASAVRFLENVVWDSADGYKVTDVDGITRIDFSSGAMITNSGHNNPAIIQAIKEQLDTGIYSSYLFPNKPRCKLHVLLSKIIPQNYQSVFLNTGSEGIETALKIVRIYANKVLKNKGLVVSFKNSYHGKMMASTAIGGTEKIKYWISPNILNELSVQVPFPNCEYEHKRCTLDETIKEIKKLGVDIKDVAAFFIEPYQGGSCSFVPSSYAQDLQEWAHKQGVLIVSDEVQSGVARTGKMWGYEHLNITPDIIVAAKGLSACLPLSAVCARKDLFDLCEPGNFNTTHSGNPICCAAAYANLNFIINNKIVTHTEKMGVVMRSCLENIQKKYPWFVSYVLGRGLAFSIHINVKYTYLLKDLLKTFIKNGLMVISPGGAGGTTFKLVPPLIIDEQGIKDGCNIIEKSVCEIVSKFRLSEENKQLL